MALDGKLLARARSRLAEIKNDNSQQHDLREAQVYSRLPAVRRIDGELRRLVMDVVAVTLKTGADAEKALRELDEKSLELRVKKAELLVQNGYSAEYLDDIYSCPKCRDTGYLPDGSMCSCLSSLYEQEKSKELSSLLKTGADCFSEFDLGYYTGADRECMEMVYDTCRRFAACFGQDSPNLLFRGGTGLGKTFLSACIARQLTDSGFSVVYDTAVSAFEAFEDQKFSKDPTEAEEAENKVRRILGCDLMILDDLGTEMTTSFTQSALYTIINSRLSSGKKTIISTNLSPAEMSQRYTMQIVSRLEGEYDTLLFRGKDIRAIKKQLRYN